MLLMNRQPSLLNKSILAKNQQQFCLYMQMKLQPILLLKPLKLFYSMKMPVKTQLMQQLTHKKKNKLIQRLSILLKRLLLLQKRLNTSYSLPMLIKMIMLLNYNKTKLMSFLLLLIYLLRKLMLSIKKHNTLMMLQKKTRNQPMN